MAERWVETEFRLYRGEGDDMAEPVEDFKYIGRPMDQTENYWTATKRKIMRVRTVWGRLGRLLRREGADPTVLEMFYRVMAQVGTTFCLR